jgi:hypothetical protein
MTYTGTVGTALKLDDKDVNDPNSGFYTAQATTEQINNIPTDAKEAGELLYNKTTGKLVLYNGALGGWETVNSSDGFNGNVVINSYPTVPTDPVEGEVYYNTTTNTYQVYTDGAWQDITTSDTEIVAKSHADDPASPVNGQMYYNTIDNILRTYTNGAWSYLERVYAAYYSISCSVSGSVIHSVPAFTKTKLFTINNTDSTITYTGTSPISASVTGQILFQIPVGAEMQFGLRRNGVLLDASLLYANVIFTASANKFSVAISTLINLQPGDYLNVTCTATPATTISIFNISLKVEGL